MKRIFPLLFVTGNYANIYLVRGGGVISCLTEILELLKGAIVSFNNRNLNLYPLSKEISNKHFRFIGTLKVPELSPG